MFNTQQTKWAPKNGETVLDSVAVDYLPHFRYALRRNGHIVALYLVASAAFEAAADRMRALPLDMWTVTDRQA